jgi:hypothetical protein
MCRRDPPRGGEHPLAQGLAALADGDASLAPRLDLTRKPLIDLGARQARPLADVSLPELRIEDDVHPALHRDDLRGLLRA